MSTADFPESEVRRSLAAWLRWHTATDAEIERAPNECRLFLRAMSTASGAQVITRIADGVVAMPPDPRGRSVEEILRGFRIW